ncbi:hypothetical protein Tco_1449619 [Tanacetum coccineum]
MSALRSVEGKSKGGDGVESGDGVTNHTQRRHNSSSDDVTYFKMASARTDSNEDLEDSFYDGVTIKT